MFRMVSLLLIIILLAVSSIFGQSAIVDQGTSGVSFNIGYSHYFASVTMSYDDMEHTFDDDDGAWGLNAAYFFDGRADLGISFSYENESMYNVYTWGLYSEILPIKEGTNGIPFSIGISGSIAHSSTELLFGRGGTVFSMGGSLYKFVDISEKTRIAPGINFTISKPDDIDALHYVLLGIGSSFELGDRYLLTITPTYGWQTNATPDNVHILDQSYHIFSINFGLLHLL